MLLSIISFLLLIAETYLAEQGFYACTLHRFADRHRCIPHCASVTVDCAYIQLKLDFRIAVCVHCRSHDYYVPSSFVVDTYISHKIISRFLVLVSTSTRTTLLALLRFVADSSRALYRLSRGCTCAAVLAGCPRARCWSRPASRGSFHRLPLCELPLLRMPDGRCPTPVTRCPPFQPRRIETNSAMTTCTHSSNTHRESHTYTRSFPHPSFFFLAGRSPSIALSLRCQRDEERR